MGVKVDFEVMRTEKHFLSPCTLQRGKSEREDYFAGSWFKAGSSSEPSLSETEPGLGS
jgi:hypothetical protein